MTEDEEEADREIKLEEMLLSSMINMQLERLRKMVPNQFNHSYIPKVVTTDLPCFGIEGSIPSIHFFDGGFRLLEHHKVVPFNLTSCKGFDDWFTDMNGKPMLPPSMMDNIMNYEDKIESTKELLTSKYSEFTGTKNTDKAKMRSDEL
jgi:hypothetical protein